MEADLNNQLLDRAEAAQRAGISTRSLDRMIAEGRGPRVTRMGLRRVLIAERDLTAWIENAAEQPRAA